ncbi:hypothetical protein [Mycoplasma sp. 1012]
MKKAKILTLSTLTVLPVSALFIVSCQQAKSDNNSETKQPATPEQPVPTTPSNENPSEPGSNIQTTPVNNNPENPAPANPSKTTSSNEETEEQPSDSEFKGNENDFDYSKVKDIKANELSKQKEIYKKVLVFFYKSQGDNEAEAQRKANEFVNVTSDKTKELKLKWYKFIRSKEVRSFAKTLAKTAAKSAGKEIGKIIAKELIKSIKEISRKKRH